MPKTLTIALAQQNFLVGDIGGNAEKILAVAARAAGEGCDLVAFPEMAVSGYPPEDLVLRADFVRAAEAAVAKIAAASGEVAIAVGHPRREGGGVFNSVTVARGGKTVACYDKRILPNYAVFDERRYFRPGASPVVLDVNGARVGITICEDLWEDGPLESAVAAGAQLVVNCNGSPFHMGKCRERESLIGARARAARVAVAYVNLVGGQDELVFDGGSFVVDAAGAVAQRLPFFCEAVAFAKFTITADGKAQPLGAECAAAPSAVAGAYRAIVLGVRDYVNKNGFDGAVVGLSGGVDSALTLAIAVDALGADKVEAVLMPSRHTRDMSVADAREQAERLGVKHHNISIEPLYRAFLAQLAPLFAGRKVDATEENLQARCRGVLLMALSNKNGKILLTTGNKSEMAVGYATLYGDMAGGFAAIKDVPKTLVYKLAEHRNAVAPVIPRRVLEREPSAELSDDQHDSDSLPPYPALDAILEAYIERDQGAEEIIAAGHDAATVKQVLRLVNRNEYKRRQAAPGVRITPRAFGKDRRYPITSGFGR